jgi:tRNA 5-methylaminomethyl-2-thiouridine biosynthesis bifunctional protein
MLNSAQVCLDLLFGDAQQSLSTLLDSPSRGVTAQLHQPHADAWFLDGFSPAINPDMWSEELLACIGALSQTGTTFATVTSADDVKRGLREQGFALSTVKDDGRKRLTLSGKMANTPSDSALKPSSVALPWYRQATTHKVQKAIVIGSGLAGCHTAPALAKRGMQVTVIERDNIASAASGNPQGILYTKPSPDPGVLNQFTLSSFLYALRHYQSLLTEQRISGDLCGVLQLMQSAREQSQYQQPNCVICAEGYLAPAMDGQICLGASFNLRDKDTKLRDAEHDC